MPNCMLQYVVSFGCFIEALSLPCCMDTKNSYALNVLVEWNLNSKHLKSFLLSSLFPMKRLGALPTLPVWWPSIVLLSYLWRLTVLREPTQTLSAYSAPCLFTVLPLAGRKTFRKAWLRFLYSRLCTGLFIGTPPCYRLTCTHLNRHMNICMGAMLKKNIVSGFTEFLAECPGWLRPMSSAPCENVSLWFINGALCRAHLSLHREVPDAILKEMFLWMGPWQMNVSLQRQRKELHPHPRWPAMIYITVMALARSPMSHLSA